MLPGLFPPTISNEPWRPAPQENVVQRRQGGALRSSQSLRVRSAPQIACGRRIRVFRKSQPKNRDFRDISQKFSSFLVSFGQNRLKSRRF
jgi:hypothetical protein